MSTDNSLKKSAFSGVLWKFGERFFAQFVSLIVSIVLARILDPEDFVPVGIAIIFFTFANVFISNGFNTALIQKKDPDILDYSSVFWFSLIIAVGLYALLFVLSPWIAQIYHTPVLSDMFRLMGITLLINAVKSVLCAYIAKNLQFKKFFLSTSVGTAVSAAVGILMAVRGYGAWSLVAQQMTNSIIDTLMLFLTTRMKISLSVSFARLKKLFDYGWKVLVASLISAVYDEASPLIIGLKFTTVDLTYYTKGRSFPSLINSAFNDTIAAVLFPVMSKVQDDNERVLQATRRFMQVSSFFVFPTMVGFFCVSDTFVSVVLTDKWLGAAVYIRIFCLCYMFNIIQNGNLQTIKAIGRSDILLKLEVIKKLSYLIILIAFVLLAKSPIYIAVSSIFCTVIATLVNTYPTRKLIQYSYKKQIMDLLPNLAFSIIMGAVVILVAFLIESKILCLLCQIATGVVVYTLCHVLSKSSQFRYVKGLLAEMLHRF